MEYKKLKEIEKLLDYHERTHTLSPASSEKQLIEKIKKIILGAKSENV